MNREIESFEGELRQLRRQIEELKALRVAEESLYRLCIGIRELVSGGSVAPYTPTLQTRDSLLQLLEDPLIMEWEDDLRFRGKGKIARYGCL